MRHDEHRLTVIDYLVAAVCPLLIVALAQSLALFIGEVVYRGEHTPHLRWTLFWFCLGMVGVSRIAIEKTRMYAGLYALGLGAATALLLSYFFQMNWVAWGLLAFIWWCVDKLTFDTTLVDEEEDASGEGLLGRAGAEEATDDSNEEKEGKRRPKRSPVRWRQFFINDPGRKERPHAPGLWVIYFLIGAMPVFSGGQIVLRQTGGATLGLILAVSYYAAGLCLLMLTSLLGLRRYLRQRRLKMPAAMAGTWITVGALICGAVILGGLLLPRPGALSVDTGWVETALRQVDRETVNQRQDEQGRESEEAGDAPEQPASEESSPGEKASPENPSSRTEQANRGEPPPGSSPSADPNLVLWLKWLVWIAFGIGLLVFIARNWAAILAALGELWESLRSLFQPKARERRRPAMPLATSNPDGRPVTFDECDNPFRGRPGDDPVRTVVLTFEAVQAWANDHALPRRDDMTEHEFIRALAAEHSELRDELRTLARVYSGIVYAERVPRPDELAPLESLWRLMEAKPEVHA